MVVSASTENTLSFPLNTQNGAVPKKSSDSSPCASSKPEDYLTLSDVKMIEYVSGTTSLQDAEMNPNAKALVDSLGYKRQYGYVQGDVSKNYYYSQLTSSDAKMIEGMTGTTNIIDAINKGGQGIVELSIEIATDRGDGSLKGDITSAYLQNIQSNETDEIAYAKSMGESLEKATPAVPVKTLLRAIRYLSETPSANINLEASA